MQMSVDLKKTGIRLTVSSRRDWLDAPFFVPEAF